MSSAALDTADAVLIYADGGKGHPAIQGDRMKVIDALAAKGVGLGFAHYGVEVPAGPPGDAMHRWVGGYYEHLFSVNPMWKPPFEKFPAHPVTRGVGPFATHDEWYFNMRWTADAAAKALGPDRVHTVSGLPGTDGPVPLAGALTRLRGLGERRFRLVLPVPGDVRGLPRVPGLAPLALERGILFWRELRIKTTFKI